MARSSRRELEVLDAVALAANQEADLDGVMQRALDAVCDLLDLPTGWVYVLEEESREPWLAAARRLPPVFQKEPERWEGLCFCVHSLLTGDPAVADNVSTVSCSRLHGVEESGVSGLRYHATIPLAADGKQFGVMNLASAGWRAVPVSQLPLLQSIGRQLGLAVERRRAIAAEHDRAVAEERARVARELHDTLMQGLTGIALQLETADALAERDGAAARGRIQTALRLTQETLAETRAAVENLAPPALAEQPLHEAVAALTRDFEALYGIAVHCEARAIRPRPPAAVGVGLYHIVREGLNNVVKHSGASQVRIALRARRGRISLIIEDDGRGFEPGRVSGAFHGYGLHSMRRRALLMGGRFRLRTAPGKGTRVEITVPQGEPPTSEPS